MFLTNQSITFWFDVKCTSSLCGNICTAIQILVKITSHKADRVCRHGLFLLVVGDVSSLLVTYILQEALAARIKLPAVVTEMHAPPRYWLLPPASLHYIMPLGFGEWASERGSGVVARAFVCVAPAWLRWQWMNLEHHIRELCARIGPKVSFDGSSFFSGWNEK